MWLAEDWAAADLATVKMFGARLAIAAVVTVGLLGLTASAKVCVHPTTSRHVSVCPCGCPWMPCDAANAVADMPFRAAVAPPGLPTGAGC